MRTALIRRVLLLSLVAGILAGAVAAVAVPRHGADPTAPRVPLRRAAAPLPQAPGQLSLHVAPGSVRVVVTATDPAGGPGWAVRQFHGTYALPADVPRHRVGKELFGRKDCLELGRVVEGRFGWLDGSGTFRPAPAGAAATPRSCRAHGAAPGRDAQLLTWVTHPDFGQPRPAATIVWGATAPGVRSLTVNADGADAEAHRAPGAFLAFLPAHGREPDLHVTATDSAGHTMELYERFDHPPPGVPRSAVGRLMARTADPTGGASWGVAAVRAAPGRWCFTNAGRVVDGAVGQLDARLDLFYDQSRFAYNCPPEASVRIRAKYRTLTRRNPLMYGFTTGDVPSQARPGGSAGRVALRAQPGTTVFHGLARPDVRTITVTTPSQTRTIRPSGPAHAFVVAFDGSFPTGRIRFTSTFTDGRTAIQGDQVGDV